jgi:NAD(P)-dependent dehydrogenase (short-subunit alcohol dehydrogenase family)
MNQLSNRTTIITGASGGIGRALVQAFLEAGARVMASDIANSDLSETEYCRYTRADVSDEGDVQHLIAQTIETFGALDILINNAAVLTPTAPVHETSLEEFEKIVAVNLRGTYLLCKYSYPHLKQRKGCIINVSSMAGVHGEKHHAIYSASKGAINALTQSMAIDYGPDGIRCNAICPSSVLTPNVDKMIEELPNAEEIVHLRKSINVLGYTATPDQIAAVAVFLASPAAAFMTGSIVPVSGGSECGYGIKY